MPRCKNQTAHNQNRPTFDALIGESLIGSFVENGDCSHLDDELRLSKTPLTNVFATSRYRALSKRLDLSTKPLDIGIVGPIHGTNPALRGQPSAVQNRSRRFCRLRRQDAEANIGAADGPEGEAQDVPSNVVSLPCSTEQNKKLAI
jgi:hypothetical protein